MICNKTSQILIQILTGDGKEDKNKLGYCSSFPFFVERSDAKLLFLWSNTDYASVLMEL